MSKKNWLITIAILLAFLVSNLWQVFRDLAFADDFSFLYVVNVVKDNSLLEHNFREGRYLSGIFQHAGFYLAKNVDGLVLLRFLSFLGLMLLMWNIRKRYVASLDSHASSKILVALFLLPVFTQYIFFATTWMAFWILNLVWLATLKTLEAGKKSSCIALLLITVAGFFSQSFPFWTFAFLGLHLLIEELNIESQIRITLKMLFLVAGGTLLNVITTLVINNLLSLGFSSRIDIVDFDDIPEKLFWFLSRPLILIYRPFLIDSPRALEALIVFAVMFALTLFLFLRSREEQFGMESQRVKLQKFGILQFLILLSLTPLILWNQNQIEFRLVGSGAFLALSIMVVSIVKISKHSYNSVSRFTSGILVVVLILIPMLNVLRFEEFRKSPFELKEAFIERSLTKCRIAAKEFDIVYKLPENWPTRNLLGDYSVGTDLQMPWVPPSDIALKGLELSIKVDKIDEFKGAPIDKTCLIDFQKFINESKTMLSSSRWG